MHGFPLLPPSSDAPGGRVQVHADFEHYGQAAALATACLYGGSPYQPQEGALRRGLDVVVGTPGRVKDHLERGTLRLHKLQCASRCSTAPWPRTACCLARPAAAAQHAGERRAGCEPATGAGRGCDRLLTDTECEVGAAVCRIRVLDECDEMLNMGFVDDVEKVCCQRTLLISEERFCYEPC